MLSRDQIIATITKIYAARVDGNMQALSQYWTPDATFRIAGDSMGEVMATGPDHPERPIGELVDQFRFHRTRIVDAIVEGNRAAVHMEVEVSASGGRMTTEFVDLWEFAADGRFRSLQQFIDTALVRKLAG